MVRQKKERAYEPGVIDFVWSFNDSNSTVYEKAKRLTELTGMNPKSISEECSDDVGWDYDFRQLVEQWLDDRLEAASGEDGA
jgi:hypothetical protein